MSDAIKVGFVPLTSAARGILIVFCDDDLKVGPATAKALGGAAEIVKRAAAAASFKGKTGAALDILAPEGLKVERLIVIGTGKTSSLKGNDFLKFGGIAAGKLKAGTTAMTIMAELATGAMTGEQAVAIASGLRLRAYKFDRYKTKKKDGEEGALRADVSLAVGDAAAAKKTLPRPVRSSTASSSRAISSTSRRTCSSPRSSRAVPVSCASSESRSRCSTSRRCRSSAWARCSASARARRVRAAP